MAGDRPVTSGIRVRSIAAAGLICSTLLGTACSNRPGRSDRLPVSLPDLSRMDAPVQAQIRDQFASLTGKIEAAATPDAELSTSYGTMGMLLMAAEYHEAAEPCFLNAQALAPGDVRWPHYLGYLYKSTGDVEKSVRAFERVLEVKPDDLAALVWLGRLRLDRGETEIAEPLFVRARALPTPAVAVLAGLGQVALARREFQQAATYLEDALKLDPQASSVHSPLALAYRGLGDIDKAEAHLKRWSNRDIPVPDPLRQELDLLLQSGLSYELRGVRALEAREWAMAAELFRKGLTLTAGDAPLGRSLRHKLGTALFLSGDARGAMEQFLETARLAPTDGLDESTAKANYSLGVLTASIGRGEQAIAHFQAAVTYQPTYVEARLGLADALRRDGRLTAAIGEYARALELSPRLVEAEFGYALALVRIGRHREARDRLTRAIANHPDETRFTLALARVLAASPDAGVRDGARALALVDQLLKGGRNLELGETLAMALAELGDYATAAATLRDVVASAERAGLRDAARRLSVNLRLYESRQPCRAPWQNDDPVHSPGPPVDLALRAALESPPGA